MEGITLQQANKCGGDADVRGSAADDVTFKVINESSTMLASDEVLY